MIDPTQKLAEEDAIFLQERNAEGIDFLYEADEVMRQLPRFADRLVEKEGVTNLWCSLRYESETRNGGRRDVTLLFTRLSVILYGNSYGCEIDSEVRGVYHADEKRIALVTNEFVAIVDGSHSSMEEP